jgi:bleomycin hydrolase
MADEPTTVDSQEPQETTGFGFVRDTMLPCTVIKNQARTNTCWCFATNSFLEAELLRLGKGDVNLSEMFIVRHIYPMKAERYVRRQGKSQFAGGGLTNNVIRVWRDYGAVPERVYPGTTDDRLHDQYELDRVLKAMLDAVISSKKVNPAWRQAVTGTLDAYLGTLPKEFEYEGTRYTPKQFAEYLGLDADDYVQITSFTHHPFYREIELELPDNWAGDRYWNVPLGDLMETMKNSIAKGYTFVWDGDISERSCKRSDGVAILPAKDWQDKTEEERKRLCKEPESELEVTQALRQQQFDSFRSTDDHLMHVVGTAHDRLGTLYFVVKDSYGSRDHGHDGLVYMSEPYFRSKTIAILVQTDVVPANLAKRQGKAKRE